MNELNRAVRTTVLTLLACFTVAAPAQSALEVVEEQVVVSTPDGSAEAALAFPSADGKWPSVLLWPDIAGLRTLYRTIAHRLAAEGFVVLVPNSFYRSVRPSDEPINARDPEVRARLTQYRNEATDEGIARDTTAYVAFLDAHRRSDASKKVAAVGYDLGASYAFRAAAALPERIGAVASIYGLAVATPRPNSPHLLVPQTKAAYYVALARDDAAREPEDIIELRRVIADAGLSGTVEVRDADHGWADPAGRTYDPVEAERAFQAILTLLKANLN